MIRRDMPEVLEIENAGFGCPWTEDEFLSALRRRNVIGMVAEWHEKVAGFMLYELHKTSLHVIDLAVHPGWQRQGVGAQMVDKLIGKLSPSRRTYLTCHLRETNLPAQMFCRSQGLRAVQVLRRHYDNCEDAYLMEYRLGE